MDSPITAELRTKPGRRKYVLRITRQLIEVAEAQAAETAFLTPYRVVSLLWLRLALSIDRNRDSRRAGRYIVAPGTAGNPHVSTGSLRETARAAPCGGVLRCGPRIVECKKLLRP